MAIKIVLVRPSHPGNIGATARAMKTMGLTELVLVEPKSAPDEHAYARATHATDILDNCVITDNLTSALADSGLVIGTSARPRQMNWPVIPVSSLKSVCIDKTAILFGNERTGLSNAELGYCHKLIHIPTNPECPSLNLAAAVQIVCYELAQLSPVSIERDDEYANAQELQNFYEHLAVIIEKTTFIKATTSESILRKLTCLFQRAQPLAAEIAILRGLFKSIERKL